jgi:hypothetical protein
MSKQQPHHLQATHTGRLHQSCPSSNLPILEEEKHKTIQQKRNNNNNNNNNNINSNPFS